jgi:hypothetical protein
MSTRCDIGIYNGETVKHVYCHFDGYLEGVGATLYNNYKWYYSAEELINGGDMSSLASTIDETNYYSKRGENCPPVEECFEDYKKSLLMSDREYAYLFYRDEWYVAEVERDYIENEYKISGFTPLRWHEEVKYGGNL